MTKDCKNSGKKQDTRRCYKYKKIGYIAKDYRSGQKMKNQSVQEDINTENDDKEQGFGDSPK